MSRRWRSLVTVFEGFSRTGRARLRLAQAYQAVFRGSPSAEDQELVLADILAKSGFNVVCDPSTPDSELRQMEGRRQLYAETLYSHLTLAPADLLALENAARLEVQKEQEAQVETETF